MQKSNFALRLPESLSEQVRKAAKADGISVNQWIMLAVAEKISAVRTAEYFAERSSTGNVEGALRILKRAGRGNPPMPGDELPKARRARKVSGSRAKRASE